MDNYHAECADAAQTIIGRVRAMAAITSDLRLLESAARALAIAHSTLIAAKGRCAIEEERCTAADRHVMTCIRGTPDCPCNSCAKDGATPDGKTVCCNAHERTCSDSRVPCPDYEAETNPSNEGAWPTAEPAKEGTMSL